MARLDVVDVLSSRNIEGYTICVSSSSQNSEFYTLNNNKGNFGNVRSFCD